MRTHRFTVAALLAGVLASAVGCVSDATCRDAAVRVGTYNIRNSFADRKTPNAWDRRKADFVAFVKRLDLDVFGLQEVCPDQAAYLAANLPEYAYVGEHRGADRKSDEASPVCYRKSRFTAIKSGTFWLSETPDTPGLKGWGAACPRVCSWLLLEDKRTGKRFCFATTHTDHRSALAREKGMLLIIERMKAFGNGVPIVFTGDHNCCENEKPALAVSAILKNALYITESPATGPWRTWNGWKLLDPEPTTPEVLATPIATRNAPRIDYIYVSPGVRVFDYATHGDFRPGVKLFPSDHFPVTATIGL